MTFLPGWANAVVAVAGLIASWRWVVKPLRRYGKEAMSILREIRDSAAERRALARTQHELAGAMVQLAVMMEQQHNDTARRVEHNTERLNDLSELVVELAADFRRHELATADDGHRK